MNHDADLIQQLIDMLDRAPPMRLPDHRFHVELTIRVHCVDDRGEYQPVYDNTEHLSDADHLTTAAAMAAHKLALDQLTRFASAKATRLTTAKPRNPGKTRSRR